MEKIRHASQIARQLSRLFRTVSRRIDLGANARVSAEPRRDASRAEERSPEFPDTRFRDRARVKRARKI